MDHFLIVLIVSSLILAQIA